MNTLLKSEIVRMLENGFSLCEVSRKTGISKGTISYIRTKLEAPAPVTARRHKCPTCGHSIITETCLACQLRDEAEPITAEEKAGPPVKWRVCLHGEERARWKALKAAKRQHGNFFDLTLYLRGDL